MASECLDWLNGGQRLGLLSPQALAMRRILIKTAWKSGRKDVANERITETHYLVAKTPQTKFAKYAKNEVEMLDEVIASLQR